MTFPSPVGGVPLTGDYAPSILFATLYGLLLPGFVYRLSNKRSRCILILGSLSFVIERVIIFSLRAAQVNDDQAAHSDVQNYMQTTLGVGFVVITLDLVRLLRSLLVHSTYVSEDVSEMSPALISESRSNQPIGVPPQDQARLRFWFRRYAEGASIIYLTAFVSGTVAGAVYTSGMKSEKAANAVMALRYVSGILALLLICMVSGAALWARRLPRINQRAIWIICSHTLLLAIACMYRLSVMYHRTTSITSISPGSLNTPAEKTAFYVWQVLPEWMAIVALLSFNVREEFNTGLRGDFRSRDETPQEKEKREKDEQAKREKTMEALELRAVDSNLTEKENTTVIDVRSPAAFRSFLGALFQHPKSQAPYV